MFNVFQNTISNQVEFKGVGLHSGIESRVNVIPADDNHGIVFKRTDLRENNLIKANYKKTRTLNGIKF